MASCNRQFSDASSVIIDANVTAMIYTGDQQSALLFVVIEGP
jgi:hypothetical protein